MRFRSSYFFTGILLLFLVYGNAQELTIAKDFNACLYGLIDHSGKWVVPAKYTSIRAFDHYGYAIVMHDNRYGLINKRGKEVVPLIYEDIQSHIDNNNVYSPNESNELYLSFSSGNYWPYFRVKQNDLTGIIDTSGKILVPVIYRYLTGFQNGVAVFTTADGTQRGFLDLHGIRGYMNPDLEKKFNYSQNLYLGVYIISRYERGDTKKKIKSANYYGVMNDSARLVLPPEFDSINSAAGYGNIIEAYKDGKAFYFTKSGAKLFESGFYIPGARRTKVPALARWGITPARNSTAFGVIKADGTTTLEFIYDSITSYKNYFYYGGKGPRWQVMENGKWGLLDQKGSWILKPGYEQIDETVIVLSDSLAQYVFTVKSSGHWGATDSKEAAIIPFAYDTFFLLHQGTLFWSEKTTELLKAGRSEAFVALYDFDPVKAKKEAEEEWKEKAKKDSALAEAGFNYLSPFDRYYNEGGYYNNYTQPVTFIGNETEYNSGKKKHYQFAKKLPGITTVSITHFDPLPVSNGKLFLYQLSHEPEQANIEREYLLDAPYYSNAPIAVLKGDDGKLHQDLAYILWTDSIFTWYTFHITSPATKTAAEISSPMIVRSDGKIVLKPGILRYMNNIPFVGKPVYTVITMTGNQGVMDVDGNFLVDTTWEAIQPESRNVYWVKKTAAHYSGCYAPWNKYEVSTRKLLLAPDKQFMQPVYDTTKNSIASTATGMGIYSPKLKQFVLAPVYSGLYALTPAADKFAFMTCSGRLGICDQNGKILSDTLWNTVQRIAGTEISRQDYNSQKYIFSNEKSWILFDAAKGISKGDSALELLVIREAEKQYSLSQIKNSDRGCYNCPWLKGPDPAALLPWQRRLLFDSLIRSSVAIDYRIGQDGNRNSCGCRNYKPLDWEYHYNGHTTPTPYKRVHHTLSYQTDSAIILERACSFEVEDRYEWMAVYHSWHFTYSNILMFPDGPRVMTLDSLFTGEEWKKVIENAAMNYLREHPGIEASCSNPSMYPKLLNELFLIDSNGLVFYPQWSYHEENRRKERITFVIPWSQLRPYLRKDIADKLNLR